MLVLSREKEESVFIGGTIQIKIVDIRGNRVRLGIVAPKNVEVWREEVFIEIEKAKAAKEG